LTLISGEDIPLVDRFAAKMSIADITKGCKDKAVALRAFAERNQLGLDEIVFMGHDVNDVAAMKAAGVAAAPADAQPAARKIATIVTGAKGGEGAVRELVERILNA
jgi:3-deoxy-D-manno-octulosonate 8-phosphate phosphatase (KDO 8-P phosphatase)